MKERIEELRANLHAIGDVCMMCHLTPDDILVASCCTVLMCGTCIPKLKEKSKVWPICSNMLRRIQFLSVKAADKMYRESPVCLTARGSCRPKTQERVESASG